MVFLKKLCPSKAKAGFKKMGHDNLSIFKIMLKYRYESKKTSM
ncbi:hypothetical protein [uncultured Gammaproteobacteria bacterium]|nr:hypothetical protein [uncultured Gammaproteobacteria bacterium]